MLQRNPRPTSAAAERYASSVALTDYYSAPKYFGELSTERLVGIISKAADRVDTLQDPHAAMAYHEVMASGLVELGLTSGSIGEAVDDRIAEIQLAAPLFREVADTRYRELETGFRTPDDQTEWRRAELHYDFAVGHVYSDVIAGEVSRETQTETLHMLQRHLGYARGLLSGRYATAAKGLESELVALIDWWQNIDFVDVAAAIPATYRGGSGVYSRTDTHDIAVAHFQQGSDRELTWEFCEVKTKNALTKEHLARYASRLIVVGKDNAIDSIPSQASFTAAFDDRLAHLESNPDYRRAFAENYNL